METTEGNNLKPQQTGGLKLMTVFIAVLALHVVVIGGFTVYHLLSTASSDPDLALDKNHKSTKVLADGSLAGDAPATDAGSTDKIAPAATTTPTDVANAPAPLTPAPTAPAPAATTTTPTPSAPAPVAESESTVTSPTAQTPSGPIQHGPVISPPENLAPAPSVASESSSMATPSSAPLADSDATPVADGTSYTVRKGDSLARIAHQHHIALAKLRAANSLASDRLRIGQKVTIPSRGESMASTTVPANAIADSDTASGPSDIIAPSTLATPSHHAISKTAGRHLYTVVKGDTLIKIARRYHTTPTAIMTANNLNDAGRLSIGKKLRIPSGESRSAAASTPNPAPTEQSQAKSGPKGQLANYVQ